MRGQYESPEVATARVVQEAAHAVTMHGFTEQEFGSVDGHGWNGIVVVSAVILDNLGEHELADALRERGIVADLVVWLSESPTGLRDSEYHADGYGHARDMLRRFALDEADDEARS